MDPKDYLPGEANIKNRIIETKAELKFIEISAPEAQALAAKLHLSLTERLRNSGAIIIGPVSRLHYAILAESLGINPENISEDIRQALIEARYINAGHLLNLGGKSLITGTSITLFNEKSIPFQSLEGTGEKKTLDQATQKRLRDVYGDTWEFTV